MKLLIFCVEIPPSLFFFCSFSYIIVLSLLCIDSHASSIAGHSKKWFHDSSCWSLHCKQKNSLYNFGRLCLRVIPNGSALCNNLIRNVQVAWCFIKVHLNPLYLLKSIHVTSQSIFCVSKRHLFRFCCKKDHSVI